MIVQRLPGGSVVLDPVALDRLYVLAKAGVRQLRVDGLRTPPEFRAVLAAVEDISRTNGERLAAVGRPTTADVVPSGLMTVSEAAAQVGRPEKTVRTWAASGRLPSAQQRGRFWLVDPTEVQEVAGG